MSSYYEKMADGTVKCIDDEIPFEIPASWEWCRIPHIGFTQLGKTKNPNQTTGELLPYLCSINVYWDGIKLDNLKQMYFDSKEQSKYIIRRGDLLVCEGGDCGRASIYMGNEILYYQNALHCIRFYGKIETKFIWMCLNLYHQTGWLDNYIKGETIKHLVKGQLESILFPLPPYIEQKRIIDSFEQLQPYIERFRINMNALDDLNTNMPILLRKGILQEAIQGKLVPQIASEGDVSVLLQQIEAEKEKLVKEGKLKKKDLISSTIFRGDDNKYFENKDGVIACIDEEVPFDIPETWQWVRLEQLCSYIQRGKSPKYSQVRQFPVVAQKCNQWDGFSIEKALFIDPNTVDNYTPERLLEEGDLMWNSTGLGTLGRMAIYRAEKNPYGWAVADSHVTVIRPLKSYVLPEYLYMYFASPTVQSVIEDKAEGSTKQKELATNTVKAYIVSLPPLEEQKRIIEKANFVMGYIW